jgi:hypothetical protein
MKTEGVKNYLLWEILLSRSGWRQNVLKLWKKFISSRDGVYLGPEKDTLVIRIDWFQYRPSLFSVDNTFNAN